MSTKMPEENKNPNPARTNHCKGHPERNRLCLAATATLSCGENPGSYRDRVSACRENCDFFVEVMDKPL